MATGTSASGNLATFVPCGIGVDRNPAGLKVSFVEMALRENFYPVCRFNPTNRSKIRLWQAELEDGYEERTYRRCDWR
jgi:hypothetical protein